MDVHDEYDKTPCLDANPFAQDSSDATEPVPAPATENMHYYDLTFPTYQFNYSTHGWSECACGR